MYCMRGIRSVQSLVFIRYGFVLQTPFISSLLLQAPILGLLVTAHRKPSPRSSLSGAGGGEEELIAITASADSTIRIWSVVAMPTEIDLLENEDMPNGPWVGMTVKFPKATLTGKEMV